MTTANFTSSPPSPSQFSEILGRHWDRVLFKTNGGSDCLYGDVLSMSRSPEFAAAKRRLVLCLCDNSAASLAGYLALLAADAVVMVVDSDISAAQIFELISAYQPDFAWIPVTHTEAKTFSSSCAQFGAYQLIGFAPTPTQPLHPSLSLLISTSGSTGSQKFVRLSSSNLISNARSIASYLNLTDADVPITLLPPSYTFGLSVIHSHLIVGSTIALTSKTLFDKEFWHFFKEAKATSLSGVPFHMDILRRLRFWQMTLPHLRTITQAGGRLAPEVAAEFAKECSDRGIRFFAMYGQAEATARISYLEPSLAISKAGSIGKAIPGGELWLEDETGQRTDDHFEGEGQLVYRGPNVCMGYATNRSDLARGDDNDGTIRTGDMARRDQDGCFYIVGRLKRFLKLFGKRVNLAEIESWLIAHSVEAICGGEDDLLSIYLVGHNTASSALIKQKLSEHLRVHPSAIRVLSIPAIPRNKAGKPLYQQVASSNAEVLA